MDSNKAVSQEIQRETKTLYHGLATAGLGELALVGAIAVQHRFREAEGLQISLIAGGFITIGRGLVQMISSGGKLQEFRQERDYLDNHDSLEP